MEFIVTKNAHFPGTIANFPTIILFDDNWDDFSFKTLFEATLWIAPGEKIELGGLKILDIDLPVSGGRTVLDERFARLDDRFGSLGQSISYYDAVARLHPAVKIEFLECIRDIAYYPGIRDIVEKHPGFETSLLRFSGANKCLLEGKSIIEHTFSRSDILFAFKYSIGKSECTIPFDFSQSSMLPSNINVIVGRNGCGKTELLSRLARGVVNYDDDQNVGKFAPGRPLISRLIAISYSAFDTFELPDKKRSRMLGYKYCGLRAGEKLQDPADNFEQLKKSIKSAEQLGRIENIVDILSRIIEPDRAIEFINDARYRKRIWEKMSAGQRIVTSIIADIAGFIERESLVLLDEPETHLHPGLLSSLMAALQKLLRESKSFCIIATHSPIILQHVPSRYVRLLKRTGDQTIVVPVPIETFGENLQVVTEKIFGLAEPEVDFHDVLDELLNKLSSDEIMELFDGRLSLESQIYLRSVSEVL